MVGLPLRKAHGHKSRVSRQKKTGAVPSLRLRTKHPTDRPPAIRVGEHHRPRSITRPGIGQIGVPDDTRRLPRMIVKNRAKILVATITYPGGRWWVSLSSASTVMRSLA